MHRTIASASAYHCMFLPVNISEADQLPEMATRCRMEGNAFQK